MEQDDKYLEWSVRTGTTSSTYLLFTCNWSLCMTQWSVYMCAVCCVFTCLLVYAVCTVLLCCYRLQTTLVTGSPVCRLYRIGYRTDLLHIPQSYTQCNATIICELGYLWHYAHFFLLLAHMKYERMIIFYT